MDPVRASASYPPRPISQATVYSPSIGRPLIDRAANCRVGVRRPPSIPAAFEIGVHRRRITAFSAVLSLVVVVWMAAFLPSDTTAAPHPAIEITANSDLVVGTNGVTGGSGTFEDPYVIADWEIEGTTTVYPIKISGTDKWLLIRDVTLTKVEGQSYLIGGVRLDNVKNCSIMSSQIVEGYNAIRVANSRNISVSGIDATPSNNGVSVYTSTYFQVLHSAITDGSATGIYVEGSSQFLIHGNNVSGFSTSGVLTENSNYAVISNNTLWYNVHDTYGGGVTLLSSADIWVHGNTFVGNTLSQAYDDGMAYDNYWNNTYDEGGGNYWDEWTSPDEMSGELQDEPESDGIVDLNYSIPINSHDMYPLVEPIPEFGSLLMPVSAMIALFGLMLSRRRKTGNTEQSP